MTRRRHLDAICSVLDAKLGAAPPLTARRLLRPQVRWAGQQLLQEGGDDLARRFGVVALVEACRDEHLAGLDADAGLTVIQIDWREILAHACARAREADRLASCPRCGERMVGERLRGATVRNRCSGCGFVRKRVGAP
jgi:hypothetical protein